MDERLTPKPALAGLRHVDERLTISEETDLSLLALSIPLGGAAAFAAACEAVFGAPPPAPGGTTAGETNLGAGGRLLGLASDQLFVLMLADEIPASTIAARMAGAAYVVDQSDAWAMLRIAGAGAEELLERLCALDIAESAFPVGAVARTVMAHLGVILLREGATDWLALTPRSSAQAFFRECLARWACIRAMPLDSLRAGSVNPVP